MNTAVIDFRKDFVEVRIFTTFLLGSVYYSSMKKYMRLLKPVDVDEIEKMIKYYRCDKTITHKTLSGAKSFNIIPTILQIHLIKQN